MNLRQKPANDDLHTDDGIGLSARSPRLLEWLSRLTQPGFALDLLNAPIEKAKATTPSDPAHRDDWQAVAHICGYSQQDFASAEAPLPLSAAAIDFFRRNHRGTEHHASRDFLTARCDLPSPLAELYGLYLHRARLDAESALFLAQSTGSTRVARMMADLLAIGGFANGLEFVGYLGITYSVPAAFDTSAQIDRANHEALRRMALPADHPSHLLKLTPDEIGVLASSIAEKNALDPADFLEKANLLSESRQDVTRLPPSQQFATAVIERDLPLVTSWALRLAEAYARVFPAWVAGLPEVQSVIH
ncbi:MAG: hypothetical protein P4M15_11870 [Alphaproteobacteria bacterium]|nr:hypothetical protein [Alphaproteobacteria bacterium]